MRIKNWDKFQHFKNRSPIWIKLYREILDDPEYHELRDIDVRVLIGLWLIASENSRPGYLPDIKRISFRLRIDIKTVNDSISRLSHWIYHDDINMISNGYQLDTPEKRREREEKEKEPPISPKGGCGVVDERFEAFWKAYPKKIGKQAAFKAWKKNKPGLEVVLESLQKQINTDQWKKENGQFIPHPSTWLNQGRWEDEVKTNEEPKLRNLKDL